MHRVYRQTKLQYINLAIVALLTYFLNCAFQNRLPFLDIILKNEVHNFILQQNFWILLVLLVIYLINYYFIRKRSQEKINAVVFDNICREIFNRFIRPNPVANNLMKVSILKAYKRESEKPYLKVVGRYQTKRPIKKSRLKFEAGEGCAGLSYESGYFIQKNIDELDPKNPYKYYEESEKVFHLSKRKARCLNDKACDFLCIPMRYYKEDEPWGVLSIDSMTRGTFTGEVAREIENLLSCFSVFLMI